jgi:cytochrome c peroxidase
MKSSMANVYRFALGSACVLAISLMTTMAEGDADLLKRAQELFQPLPKDMATSEFPITKERVDLGRQLFFDPRTNPRFSGKACIANPLFGTTLRMNKDSGGLSSGRSHR